LSEILSSIDEEFRLLASTGTFLGPDELDQFERRIDAALATLDGEYSLELTPADAAEASYGLVAYEESETDEVNVYLAIVSALRVLDEVVYLSHAFRHFPPLATIAHLTERVRALLDRVVSEHQLPTLRLIPLNPLRSEAITAVPVNIRYLFPWYEEWSDYPDNALRLLALALSGEDVSDSLSHAQLDAMWSELQRDKPLLRKINEEVRLLKTLPTAMKQSYALQWIMAADEAAATITMPKKVVQAGMIGAAIRAAIRIMEGDSVSAMRWYAGFCGLGLSWEQRLHLLKPFEEALLAGATGDLPPVIRNWNAGITSAFSLAQKLFTTWREQLEKASERSFFPLPESVYWRLLSAENPAPIAAAINILDKSASIFFLTERIGEVKDKLSHILNDVLSQDSENQIIPACAVRWQSLGGDDTPKQQDFVLPNAGPRILNMPGGNTLLDEKETDDLAEVLDGKALFYCGGVAMNDSGEFELIDVQQGKFPFRPPRKPQTYRIIFLGLAGDRTILEEQINSHMSSEEADLPIGRTDRPEIVWVVYVRAEQEP
jgi:hypothetical protein